MTIAHEDDLKLLFLDAHTHNGWRDEPVDDNTLRQLYSLACLPPTAANSNPLRLVFIKTRAAKEKLRPFLDAGNVEKTMAAPVTAIVAYDMGFHTHMATLFPARPQMGLMLGSMPEPQIERFALMNGTLQGGYVILAARALGLDCGPMGGFHREKVNETFLAGTTWRSNFLLNLGHGDPAKVFPRNPRLPFDTACRID